VSIHFTLRDVVAFLALTSALLGLGCAGTLESIGAAMAYQGVTLPDQQILRDLPYRADAGADPEKHRLDLFLPTRGTGAFPTLIFVHGGGWTHGDRNSGFGGIRPYQNIGRFWANQGVGVAVVGYRLQPEVDWHGQVDDVADAVEWVRTHIAEHGGQPDALYLSGHSAGAWLAARLAFDAAAQRRARIQAGDLCGTILVSGAAFDVRDPRTYELGSSPRYFEQRFNDQNPDWKTRASIVPLLANASESHAPPTRIFWAEGEAKTFERQGTLLANALESAEQDVQSQRIPGLNHQKIVISMSSPESPLSRSIRDFMEGNDCSARPTASSSGS
jgi:acetyl esterase/lipase